MSFVFQSRGRSHSEKIMRCLLPSGMLPSIPEFGLAVAGRTYVLRPGSYGVIRNGVGSIAVVFTPQGIFLPGGARNRMSQLRRR